MHGKQVLKEIVEQRQIANKDLSQFDYQVQSAHGAAVSIAKEKLVDLENWYRNYFWSIVKPVFIDPASSSDPMFISKVAEKYQPHLIFSVDEVYDFLTKETWSSFTPSGEYGTNQHTYFLTILKELAMSLGILQMELPHYDSGFFVKDLAELQTYVKRMITKMVGNDLALIYTRHKIPERTLETHIASLNHKRGDEFYSQFYLIFTNATPNEVETFTKIFTNKLVIMESKPVELSTTPEPIESNRNEKRKYQR